MTGIPLVVPDQAVIELDAWTNNVLAESDKRQAVVDIAAIVVAAELRRLADQYAEPFSLIAALPPEVALHRRADEVEAQ